MPIRRRGDGEIVEEPTNPLPARGGSRPSTSPDEAPTEPASPSADSLFADAPATAKERWDAPTKPVNRADREGKTRILSPRRAAGAEEDRPPATDPMADPPVGWLVVVRGPGKGSVLTLGNGMNAIGRGTSARVRLDFGDGNISRANHARIAYDPRQRRWLLSHGDGANLTYLNGEVVMAPVPIASGAQIQLGETTLRFQAFCSQEFDWPDVDD